MCERWVGDWTNCNLLTPSSFVFNSTSFSFWWAAQSGVLRAHSPLLGACSLDSILYPTNWLQLTELPVTPGYIIVWLLPVSVASAPNSTRPQSRLYPNSLDRMHLFLDWRLGQRSICYIYCCWEILRFVSDSFFLLTPFTCYFLIVCRSCQGIKDRKGKRQGYLETQFLFLRCTTTVWWNVFCWTSRNKRATL